MVRTPNRPAGDRPPQEAEHQDVVARNAFERLRATRCVPPQFHFSNSEVRLANGGKRTVPLMNTEVMDRTVRLLKGETIAPDIKFEAAVWDPSQLMFMLSLLLTLSERPPLIIFNPLHPCPMWYAVYCCLFFDSTNLISWHDGDTDLPDVNNGNEFQNHWVIRSEAETRLITNFFYPHGADRELFGRLRSEWRKYQKYLYLNSRFSQQHTHQQEVDGFLNRIRLIIFECARAASANYDTRRGQLAEAGDAAALQALANHPFHQQTLQQRSILIAQDLRVYIGFDFFGRPDPVWINARVRQEDVLNYSININRVRRHLQRFFCTQYLAMHPLPPKTLKNPPRNHHIGDDGIEPYLGAFVPQEYFFFDYEQPAPNARFLHLAGLDKPFFDYMYDHIWLVWPKHHLNAPFHNVYPQLLALARHRRTQDLGTAEVPRPADEPADAGIAPLPRPLRVPWVGIVPAVDAEDANRNSQMTAEEYAWYLAHKRDIIVYVPFGAHNDPQEEEEGERPHPRPHHQPPQPPGPHHRPDEPRDDDGGDGRDPNNPLPRPPREDAPDNIPPVPPIRNNPINNLPIRNGDLIPLEELLDAVVELGEGQHPPLRRSPFHSFVDEDLTFERRAAASKKLVVVPEEADVSDGDESMGKTPVPFKRDAEVVQGDQSVSKKSVIVPEDETPLREFPSSSKKSVIEPEKELQFSTAITAVAFDDFFAEDLDPHATQKSASVHFGPLKINRPKSTDKTQNNLRVQRNLFLEEFRRDERKALMNQKKFSPPKSKFS